MFNFELLFVKLSVKFFFESYNFNFQNLEFKINYSSKPSGFSSIILKVLKN